jgi:putative SOS response-associated peptidase YedK
MSMCGRYTLTSADPDLIRGRFGAPPLREGMGRYNIAPTDPVLVVRPEGEGDGREALLARWGLLGPGARSLKDGPAPINARVETVADKPLFARRLTADRGRVLVIADGYYEWQRPEDPRQPRQPFRYLVDGGEPFAFAGLCSWVRLDEQWHATVAILTTPPNELCARVHDRMPAILAGPAEEQAWMSVGVDGGAALELCRPLPSGRMSVLAANPLVNSVANDSPEVLAAPDPQDAAGAAQAPANRAESGGTEPLFR